MEYFIIAASFSLVCYYSAKFRKTSDLILLLPLFYGFVVLYTFLGIFVFKYAIDVPFGLYELILEDDLYASALSFLTSSFFFYLGAVLVGKKGKASQTGRVGFEITRQKTLIFSVMFVYLLYIAGYGAEFLLYRNGYIDTSNERNKSMIIFFFVISPFVTTLIPFIKTKYIKYFTYILCFFVLFSSSSRFIVMVPFLYVVGTFLRFNRIRLRVVLFNFLLVCFSLLFILQIRNNDFHGLLPNLSTLFIEGIDLEYLWIGLNYAFSFSLFGTSYVLSGFEHNPTAFFISLNPMPSRFVDIGYMLEAQRMLGTSPMSAIATLSLAGYPTLISFYFFTGVCFSYFFNRMKGQTIAYYIVVGLFILFTLFSIQYNLRGLSRFFYYSIIIFVTYSMFKKLKIKRRIT